MIELSSSIYLVETPDPIGEVALVEAFRPLNLGLHEYVGISPEEATIIRNASTITGFDDGIAKAIGDLYEFGEIERCNFLNLKKLLNGESPLSDEICEEILKLIEEGLLPEDFLGNYLDAGSKFTWSDLTLVNRDGLVSGIDDYGDLLPSIENIDEMCDDKSYAPQTAISLGLTICATQVELVFTNEIGIDNEGYTHPRLFSDREHVSLGRLDSEGIFTPVLTVLNTNHPAISI